MTCNFRPGKVESSLGRGNGGSGGSRKIRGIRGIRWLGGIRRIGGTGEDLNIERIYKAVGTGG